MNFDRQTTAAYQSEAAYQGVAAAQHPSSRGPIQHASNTFDGAIDLSLRVQALADKLCGGQLCEKEDGGIEARPGIFGAIDATCTKVDRHVMNAIAAINRIEAELQ